MPWPQATDYTAAVQNPAACFTDSDLAGSSPEMNVLLGTPLSWCGNFAIVFKLVSPSGEAWAAKCFIREVTDHQDRYSLISRHLEQNRKRFAVEFSYQPEGIRLGSGVYPLVKMKWVEGNTLNEFLRDHAGSSSLLEQLASLWLRLAGEMRDAKMAHGDLQHGNALLVPGKNAASMVLRLVDYDGMWVPDLEGRPPGEKGHANYQHPQRLREGGYSSEIDRFPHLAIYAGLRCLAAGGKTLWDRHDSGENLLFRETDFSRPEKSKLLPELFDLGADASALAAHVVLASRAPLAGVPLVSELVSASGAVMPLRPEQRDQMAALFPGARAFRKTAMPPPPPAAPPPLPLSPDWLAPENVPLPAPGGAARRSGLGPPRPPSSPLLPELPPVPPAPPRPASTPELPPLPPLPPPVPAPLAAVLVQEVPPVPAPMAAVPVPEKKAPERKAPPRDPDLTDPESKEQRGWSSTIAVAVASMVAALALLAVPVWYFWPRAARVAETAKFGGSPVHETGVVAGRSTEVVLHADWQGEPPPGLALRLIAPNEMNAAVAREEIGEKTGAWRMRVSPVRRMEPRTVPVAAVLMSGAAELDRRELRFAVSPVPVPLGPVNEVKLRAGTTTEAAAVVYCEGEMLPLAPELVNLPKGVKQEGFTLQPDGRLTVGMKAEDDAFVAATTVTLLLRDGGREAARGTFALEVVKPPVAIVPIKIVPPVGGPGHLRLSGPRTLELRQGSNVPVALSLKWLNPIPSIGEISPASTTIQASGLPAGVRMAPVTTTASAPTVRFVADDDARPGKATVVLTATASGFNSSTHEIALDVPAPRPKPPDPGPGPETLPSRRVTFETADGLSLQGRLWPSRATKTTYTVLVLPDPRRTTGLDATVVKLCVAIQNAKQTVLCFDFRGQGASRYPRGKEVPLKFWTGAPANAGLKAQLAKGLKGPERSSPPLEKLPSFYMPWLVQDIIAARHWLDRRHDAGELNSQNLLVMALGESGQLASLWLATETMRHRTGVPAETSAPDVKGMLLVGVPPMAGTGSAWTTKGVHYALLKKLPALPPVQAITDGGLHGSGKYLADLMYRKGGASPTASSKGAATNYGHNLLALDGLQDHVVQRLQKLPKAASLNWKDRDYDRMSYTWRTGRFIEPRMKFGNDMPNLFPLQQLGFGSLNSGS